MKFVQVLTAIGLSAVKHTLGGVPLAAGFGFSYLETAGYTALGGMIGVGIFVLFAHLFQRILDRAFPNKKKRKFSRKTRFIVRVKRSFGLGGIAFITPSLLSIPVGTVISCGIYPNKTRVFLFQSLSIVFWSFLGAGLVQPLMQIFH